METLKLTQMPSTNPSGLIIKIQSNHVWCDFSGLVDIEAKKDFIESAADIVNYNFQMPDSVTAHSITDRSDDVEAAKVICETPLSNILTGVNEPTYLKYKEFSHNVSTQELELKSWKNIFDLPFVETDNYFSSVFFHGLRKIYPQEEQMVSFVQIPDKSDSSQMILAFKLYDSQTDQTGYYNVSYKPPYDGIGLM